MRTVLAGLGLLFASHAVLAANPPVCVSTGIELRAALMTAAGNVGDNEIRIRQGTLTLFDNTLPYEPAKTGNLTVSGGWTGASGQCTNQGRAHTTVIDGQGNRQLFRIRPTATAGGLITISNLTLTGGYRASIVESAALDLSLPAGSSVSAKAEHLIIRDNDENHWGAVVTLWAGGSGSITFRNNLVTGNYAGSYGTIRAAVAANTTMYFVNNTIADNRRTAYSAHPSSGLELSGAGTFHLGNNVIVGNRDGQNNPSDVGVLWGQNPLWHLSCNHIGQLSGTPTENDSTSTGDDVFEAGNGYRPKPGSALINSGDHHAIGGIPVVDLDGNARQQGSQIDRGAYEWKPLFANGFD